MDIVSRLLECFRAHRYQLTEHALEALDEQMLTLADVDSCLASGFRRRSWPRLKKYEVEGQAVDGRLIRVVARLLEDRIMRIITVYEVQQG